MGGRLFQRLQQRVEGLLGQHVNLVNDVNFEPGGGRGIFDRLTQLAHLVNAVVARAVNFQHIQGAALGDFQDAEVVVGKVHLGAAGAVEAFGEDAGDGGFARAARPDEKVGVGNAFPGNGVDEGLGDVLLPHHILEPLRTILARYDLIRHLFWIADWRLRIAD